MKLLKLFFFCCFILSFMACDQLTGSKKKAEKPNPEIIDQVEKPNDPQPDIKQPVNPPEAESEFADIKLSEADYMKAEENQMVNEINLIRHDPPGYVKYVEKYIAQMEKDKADGVGFSNVDEEIVTARELINELNNTPKLSFLDPNEGIYNAAKKHGDEGKAKGSLDHQGSDGKWPWDRVKAAAPECADGNENLVGGSADVRRSVMMLLVDSGIPGRGHRKTLLNPAWTDVACYHVGQVGQMPNYWIQKFGKCN